METPTNLKKRLNTEGRWAEASLAFNEIFAEKKHFMRAAMARQETWIELGIRFPPLLGPVGERKAAQFAARKQKEERLIATLPGRAPFPPERPSSPATETDFEMPTDDEPADDAPASLPTGLPVGDSNFDRDFEWAYANLGAELEPSAAPSGAAWLLREIGRSPKGRDKFVAMAQKTLSKKNDTENEKKNREDRSRQFALLDSINRSFAGLEEPRQRKPKATQSAVAESCTP